jgi:hypothetical protein
MISSGTCGSALGDLAETDRHACAAVARVARGSREAAFRLDIEAEPAPGWAPAWQEDARWVLQWGRWARL